MRQALVAENADLVARDPQWAVRITGADGETGKRLLAELCDPESESPVVVTTSRMLSTGVDVPDLTHVVLFRPVGSLVEFKQIIGRGSRLYPDKCKTSFEIVDYVDATRLFDDPAFDGRPLAVCVEEVDDNGAVVDVVIETAPSTPEVVPELHEPAPVYEAGGSGEVVEDRPRTRKYVVDGVSVVLTAEGYLVPDTGTGRLRLVEYADYVGDRVRRLAPDQGELRRRWVDRRLRLALEAELQADGIAIADLEERTGRVGADPFDLLVHAAWRVAPQTRAGRAKIARAGLSEQQLDARARRVLNCLLDVYADHGIDEMSDPLALSVPPLAPYGTEVEIVRWFGDAAAFRDAVARLQQDLYPA